MLLVVVVSLPARNGAVSSSRNLVPSPYRHDVGDMVADHRTEPAALLDLVIEVITHVSRSGDDVLQRVRVPASRFSCRPHPVDRPLDVCGSAS